MPYFMIRLQNNLIMKQRDYSIDMLRGIAIICIIIAHIMPPPIVFQLRNFDVPMMVFLSGISYSLSSGQKVNYKLYVWKRIKRLIIPTWIFLTIYTLLMYVANDELLPKRLIIEYYTLDTTSYVWIIRIFFVMSLTAPIVAKFTSRISVNQSLVVLIVMILGNEALCYVHDGWKWQMLIMNIPYLAIFTYGYMINKISKRNICLTFIGMMLIFVLIEVVLFLHNNSFVPTQAYKYPPRLYYISYAMGVCCLSYLLRTKLAKITEKLQLKIFFEFIGSHSIWIYFWHVIILDTTQIDSLPVSWYVRFLFVFASALLISYVQDNLLSYVVLNINNQPLKKNLLTFFRG